MYWPRNKSICLGVASNIWKKTRPPDGIEEPLCPTFSKIWDFVGHTDEQTDVTQSTQLVIFSKNIYSLWGLPRHLLNVSYFCTKLVYRFLPFIAEYQKTRCHKSCQVDFNMFNKLKYTKNVLQYSFKVKGLTKRSYRRIIYLLYVFKLRIHSNNIDVLKWYIPW